MVRLKPATLAILRRLGGQDGYMLARTLGGQVRPRMTARQVSGRLKGLERAGYVESIGGARRPKHWAITDDGMAYLSLVDST